MDTSTTYPGLKLAHPFIAGASPLGFDLDAIKRLEDGGCAAMVIPSLFEEQITLRRHGAHPSAGPLAAVGRRTRRIFRGRTTMRSRRTGTRSTSLA